MFIWLNYNDFFKYFELTSVVNRRYLNGLNCVEIKQQTAVHVLLKKDELDY